MNPKSFASRTLAQGWIARFHPDYSIMQDASGGWWAVPPMQLDVCARRGFRTVESPQQSGAYQTGEYTPYDGNGWTA